MQQQQLPIEVFGFASQGSNDSYYQIYGRGLINASNFEKSREVQWKNLRQLKIDSVDKCVLAGMITPFKTSLTHVEFSSLTSFKNVQLIFMLCTNLEVINFSNIVLSFYNEESHRSNLLLRNVTRIIFCGANDLTHDELHVLHYLNQKVRFESLKSIAFETRTLNSPKLTGQKNIFNPAANSSVLGEFMSKHRQTLKNLEMNRSQVTLYDEGNGKCKVRNLNLNKLVCDMSSAGINSLLNLQYNLTVLHCYNSENISSQYYKAVVACIKRCRKSLRDIRIDNRVKLVPSQEDATMDNPNSRVNFHDMSIYKQCDKLRKLNVNLSLRPSNPEEEKRILSPGGVLDCSQICVSLLTNLAIRFDVIENEEMERFAAIFPQMKNMKFFLFHGNIETPYKVKLSYIQDLIRLPKILVFELCFCDMEDIEEVEQFRDLNADLEPKLGVTPHSVIYWKNK
jgi:hypothetical protein